MTHFQTAGAKKQKCITMMSPSSINFWQSKGGLINSRTPLKYGKMNRIIKFFFCLQKTHPWHSNKKGKMAKSNMKLKSIDDQIFDSFGKPILGNYSWYRISVCSTVGL